MGSGGTRRSSSLLLITGPALYSLLCAWGFIGVCLTSPHVFCRLREGLHLCPLWYSVGGALGVCLQGPLLRVVQSMYGWSRSSIDSRANWQQQCCQCICLLWWRKAPSIADAVQHRNEQAEVAPALFWMPPRPPFGGVLCMLHHEGAPWGRPRTTWRKYVSQLAWASKRNWCSLQEELSGESDVWVSLPRLPTLWPGYG